MADEAPRSTREIISGSQGKKGRDVVYFQYSLHDNLIVQRFLGLIIKSMAVQIGSILCEDFNNAFESVSRHRSRE